MEATGKAPIFSRGQLIGEVSVGFLTATVAGEVASTLKELAPYFLAVLALGILAALGLSRRLKRQTFGLELGEIAALLQEREAMLHGIREGVLGYDKNERLHQRRERGTDGRREPDRQCDRRRGLRFPAAMGRADDRCGRA
jgi:two-component system CitB family sensor kinase